MIQIETLSPIHTESQSRNQLSSCTLPRALAPSLRSFEPEISICLGLFVFNQGQKNKGGVL